jgi:hypothetical protein
MTDINLTGIPGTPGIDGTSRQLDPTRRRHMTVLDRRVPAQADDRRARMLKPMIRELGFAVLLTLASLGASSAAPPPEAYPSPDGEHAYLMTITFDYDYLHSLDDPAGIPANGYFKLQNGIGSGGWIRGHPNGQVSHPACERPYVGPGSCRA